MAKTRIIVEFEVSGPDHEQAAEVIDGALDAGAIQDAIEDAREVAEVDFTIESATIIGEVTN